MTTERKPSERTVELSDNALKAGQECMYSVVPSRFWNDDCATKLAAIISKHFPPSLESELAEALKSALDSLESIKEAADTDEVQLCWSTANSAIKEASTALTTHHQRKETKE